MQPASNMPSPEAVICQRVNWSDLSGAGWTTLAVPPQRVGVCAADGRLLPAGPHRVRVWWQPLPAIALAPASPQLLRFQVEDLLTGGVGAELVHATVTLAARLVAPFRLLEYRERTAHHLTVTQLIEILQPSVAQSLVRATRAYLADDLVDESPAAEFIRLALQLQLRAVAAELGLDLVAVEPVVFTRVADERCHAAQRLILQAEQAKQTRFSETTPQPRSLAEWRRTRESFRQRAASELTLAAGFLRAGRSRALRRGETALALELRRLEGEFENARRHCLQVEVVDSQHTTTLDLNSHLTQVHARLLEANHLNQRAQHIATHPALDPAAVEALLAQLARWRLSWMADDHLIGDPGRR